MIYFALLLAHDKAMGLVAIVLQVQIALLPEPGDQRAVEVLVGEDPHE